MTKDQLGNELQVGDTVVIQMNSFSGPKFGEKYTVLHIKGDDIIVSEIGLVDNLSTIQACKVIKWKGE